jgi:hypothetical protein
MAQVETVTGPIESMVLSHDAACFIDWFPIEAAVPRFGPQWHFEHMRGRCTTLRDKEAGPFCRPRG